MSIATLRRTSFGEQTCSYFSQEGVNDVLENRFCSYEKFFASWGKNWPVAIVTGALRALYAGCQAAFALTWGFFKLFDAAYIAIRYGRNFAAIRLQEGFAAFGYMPHAVANVMRAVLEILPLMTIYSYCGGEDYVLEYPIETDDYVTFEKSDGYKHNEQLSAAKELP